MDLRPMADAEIHRFHVLGDKPGSRNGAYQLFPYGIASSWFGTWMDVGNWHNWSSRETVDYLETQSIRQCIATAKRQLEAEQLQIQQATAVYSELLFSDGSTDGTGHAYPIREGIGAHNARQLCEVQEWVPTLIAMRVVV
jgi:putative DNA primase/helicase